MIKELAELIIGLIVILLIELLVFAPFVFVAAQIIKWVFF